MTLGMTHSMLEPLNRLNMMSLVEFSVLF